MKLDCEIAVDQQTKARDHTFEGVPGAHRCPRDSHALIWSIFGSILSNHLNNNMLKTVLWGALLVATSFLNTYKVLSKYDKIGRVCCIRNKYYRFWPLNWANINIFE